MKVRIGRNGKRTAAAYRQKRAAYRTYSRAQAESGRGGRRIEQKAPNSRQLRQLIISAVILVSVISVKLVSPQSLEPVRTELLRLMGTDTDFMSVFSAVGHAIGTEEDLGQALNDAYVAVFGTQLSEKSENFTELPDDVCMVQQVLGFDYTAPIEGSITDGFGSRQHPTTQVEQFHYGLDIEADTGTVIRSFADGTVTAVGESSALGKYVTVTHENGFATLYAHCSRITASSGQQVKMSDPIAEAGETGLTTGPHLHFEIHRDTLYLNPIYYVAA